MKSNESDTNKIKSVKRLCYLFIFAAIALVFSSCEAGWVATEPSYGVEIERPARPGDAYIWIDGGWRWDHSGRNYVRERGYWSRPRHNHSWVQGYWQSGPRGKSWVRGHWKRDYDRDDRY